MIKTADTINFYDADKEQDGVAIVRYDSESVSICLSLKLDGDIEVTMSKEDAKRFWKAIDLALQ